MFSPPVVYPVKPGSGNMIDKALSGMDHIEEMMIKQEVKDFLVEKNKHKENMGSELSDRPRPMLVSHGTEAVYVQRIQWG